MSNLCKTAPKASVQFGNSSFIVYGEAAKAIEAISVISMTIVVIAMIAKALK